MSSTYKPKGMTANRVGTTRGNGLGKLGSRRIACNISLEDWRALKRYADIRNVSMSSLMEERLKPLFAEARKATK